MIEIYVAKAAMYVATVYGVYNADKGAYEKMCGDPGKAVECGPNAITASGVQFNPEEPHVAVPLPRNYRLRKGFKVCFIHKDGREVWLPITDKKGRDGFDLSPAAVRMLGHTPTYYWSAPIELCDTPLKREVI